MDESVRQRAIKRLPRLSRPQERYINVLLIDCELSNLGPRNAWLSEEARREITAVEQLTPQEANIVIDRLRDIKRNIRIRDMEKWKKPDEDEE